MAQVRHRGGADVAIDGGRISSIGTIDDAAAQDDRRDRPGRRAGLHRHPHPLRRAGVLGHDAEPVAAARSDHRDGWQLWVHDRAACRRRRSGRPGGCRLPDADAGPRRGHAAGVTPAGSAVGLDVDRAVPRSARRHPDAERRVPRRPFGIAPRGDARRCDRTGVDARRARRDEASVASRDRRGWHGVLVDMVVVAQRPHGRARPVAARVARRARRAVPRRRRVPRHDARVHPPSG